ESRRDLLVEYQVDPDERYQVIGEDAREFAGDHRLDASVTGNVVIYAELADRVFDSAVNSFATALALTVVLLVLAYGALEGRPALGLVNTVPILVTVAALVASMRALGIPFNPLTATILAVTVGVGIDYSVHATHRFADEYDGGDPGRAIRRTLRGTGGALTGSFLTTAAGTGALVVAVTPLLSEFGLLMVLSVGYAYLTSMVLLPPLFVVYHELGSRRSI
ncbi:MAG: MMPL family transporter, partial [Halobacteriota archaeon]